MVFAALSVDGTILYLRRRQLQNIADAAALAAAEELSQTQNTTVAYQKAINSIAGNNGRIEWYSTNPTTPNPPSTNVGSGVDLTVGIQITNACDVRVALKWSDLSTYFTQFVRHPIMLGFLIAFWATPHMTIGAPPVLDRDNGVHPGRDNARGAGPGEVHRPRVRGLPPQSADADSNEQPA